MFRKKKPFKLDEFSNKNNPFEFSVSGKQVIEILDNFPDISRIKRGIDYRQFSEKTLLGFESDCSPRSAADNIRKYYNRKDFSKEITGKYVLYWNKKRREYTHEIFLSKERGHLLYLEFGTSSSQKNLNDVFSFNTP